MDAQTTTPERKALQEIREIVDDLYNAGSVSDKQIEDTEDALKAVDRIWRITERALYQGINADATTEAQHS